MSLALVTTLVLAGWSVQYLFPAAQAQAQAPLRSERRPLTAEERAAQREELLAELPADLRRELGSFERQVDWLTRYMQTWDEGTAGAVVALMLYRMSQSMDTMPSMEQQMRTMRNTRTDHVSCYPRLTSRFGRRQLTTLPAFPKILSRLRSF